MDKRDIEVLYDAFISLCDYVETDTDEGCFSCPLNRICNDKDKGNKFAETLKRIKVEIKKSF